MQEFLERKMPVHEDISDIETIFKGLCGSDEVAEIVNRLLVDNFKICHEGTYIQDIINCAIFASRTLKFSFGEDNPDYESKEIEINDAPLDSQSFYSSLDQTIANKGC